MKYIIGNFCTLYIITPISNNKKKEMGDDGHEKNAIYYDNLYDWVLTAPAYADAYNWGMMKGKNGNPAQAGQKFDEMLPKFEALYLGDTSKKDIYLTFDNGYENGYTNQILDVLKKHQAPATFFVTGHYLKTAPELVKRMVKEGHIVGNHSWSHPDMTVLTDGAIKSELLRVKEETERLTGQKTMNYLRPPRGSV